MDDQAKLHRVSRISRVFLARLLITYGTDAPAQLRLVADELEALGTEMALSQDGDIPTRFPHNKKAP